MKQYTKRYLFCSRCQTYTRAPEDPPGQFLRDVARIAYHLVTQRKRLDIPLPDCSQCHRSDQGTPVFLQTEVDNHGNEVAYVTPEGTRIEALRKLP